MKDKKIIGITTLWDTPVNYGQVLQGFALQSVLKELGYDSFIVRYTFKDGNQRDTYWMKIKRILTGQRSIFSILLRFLSKPQNDSGRDFDAFRSKYMVYSDKIFDSYRDFELDYQVADAYITGSDQVWGAYGPLDKKKYFLLDFLPDNIKRISYAASFGRKEISNADENKVFAGALSKYLAVSVREKSGVDLCGELGCSNAKWVVDPTFLMSREHWARIFNLHKVSRDKKVILVYLLSNDETNKKYYKMIDFFRSKGYEVKYVSSARFLDRNSNFNPTIEEWLQEVYSADIVLTTSYHGSIFALNFNTPVISVINGNPQVGQNSRLYSIFNNVGLGHRVISRDDSFKLDKLEQETINWDKVNKSMARDRVESMKFLADALAHV